MEEKEPQTTKEMTDYFCQGVVRQLMTVSFAVTL